MQVVTHYCSQTLFIECIPELSGKANAVLTKNMSHLHPAVIIQLVLLPPPLHMSAAVLSLCLLTISKHYKSLFTGPVHRDHIGM